MIKATWVSSVGECDELTARFPAAVRSAAQPLRDELTANTHQQAEHLKQLEDRAFAGDPCDVPLVTFCKKFSQDANIFLA